MELFSSLLNEFLGGDDKRGRERPAMKHFYKIATLISGVLLGILASMVMSKLIENHFLNRTVKLSALDADFVTKYPQSEIEQLEEDRVSSAILIDSILTIVQNYYVDRERSVDNNLLIRYALKGMSEMDGVSVSWLDSSNVLVKMNQYVYEFEVEDNYDFNSLIEDAVNLSLFIGKAGSQDPEELYSNGGAFTFLNALLKTLDPHSSLLSEEEYRELRQGTEGAFGGLGVVVGIEDNLLTVIKPLPRSPAAKAGISGKDRITFINNVSTFGTSLQNLVHHMRGAPGTEVHLSLLRENFDAPRKIKIRREIIQVDSIEPRVIESENGNILILTVESFSSRTSEEIKAAVARFKKSDDIKGVVFDLRGNPGGLLDQAVKSADLFLRNGRIVSTSGRRPEVEVAYDDGDEILMPVIIIVNSDTASASEILTGALQDNNRAIVIGSRTFGKGSVQTVFELPSQQALKLTIAKYYSPSGKGIQGSGIVPDISMRPIVQNSQNLNILGDNRYSGEKYLQNSLTEDRADKSYSRYGFYYIDDENQDEELNLTLELFNEILAKNNGLIGEDRLRATYWLASASKYIQEFSEKSVSRSERYLRSRHNIDWGGLINEEIRGDTTPLAIKVEKEHRIKEGEEFSIPWSIENTSEKNLKRVSVYLRSRHYFIPTMEILVGNVPAGVEKKGVFTYRFPMESREMPFELRLGVASDGEASPNNFENIKLFVAKSKKPSLTYNFQLVDQNGVLEPGEDATLELIVKNESSILASDLNISLANLSGRQVSLPRKTGAFDGSLTIGQFQKFRFPIKASDRLQSDKIHVGLTIDAKEFLGPLKSNHRFKAEPTKKK